MTGRTARRRNRRRSELLRERQARRRLISDPTRLVLMDEADWLRMDSFEAVRAVFDRGGLVLIGMPGMEKRLARYPQFYSRFAHAFRPLSADAAPSLQRMGGAPFTGEAAAIRFTGDNFRLPERLLTQPASPGSMT